MKTTKGENGALSRPVGSGATSWGGPSGLDDLYGPYSQAFARGCGLGWFGAARWALGV
ncbi:hypothetical protein [Pedosphaera parvula]|uniref:hypothetical protein n=1 Tax=Pedosphaera parvula TaxID=1032527 RepID=UPI00135F16BE|nr:hypothetical protein [Pedosphaera parvula]